MPPAMLGYAPMAERSPSTPRAWAALFAATGAMLSFRPEWETDPWWHLALGRAVWRTGGRTVPEPYAFPSFPEHAIAPEWGWELVTYGVWSLGGWPLLSILVMGLAAALAWVLLVAVRQLAPAVSGGALLVVSAAVLVAVSSRMRLRPEAAAYVFLTLTLLMSVRWRAAFVGRGETARGAGWGGGLVLVSLAWVQVHGSAVLAPILFVIAGVTALDPVRGFGFRPGDVVVAAGMLVAQFTGAWGLDFAGYVTDHATGTSVMHIKEFQPMTWDWISPMENPRAAAFLGLAAVGLVGALGPLYGRQGVRGFQLRNFVLALLGVVLAVKARRFLGLGTLLVAPLAASGLGMLLPRLSWWAAALPSGLGVAWFAAGVDRDRGPLGTLGLAEGAHPFAAAAALERAGVDGNVFTGFAAGAALGFISDGRIRIFMDSRAPLYFDDLAFGRWRDAARDPAAFLRMAEIEGTRWAVIERTEPACEIVAAEWQPVAVDAMFTTFSAQATPLIALLPCGRNWIAPDACADPRRFAAEVADRTALKDDDFSALLKAEFVARCLGQADAAEAQRPPAPRLRSWTRADRLLRARIALLRDDRVAAVAVVESDVRAGDVDALSLVGEALLVPAPLPDARAILTDAVSALDDDAPPDLRADLAWLCSLAGDTVCVRDEAIRAASAGSQRAVEPLRWLMHEGDERARAEAERWLGVLAAH